MTRNNIRVRSTSNKSDDVGIVCLNDKVTINPMRYASDWINNLRQINQGNPIPKVLLTV